MGHYVTQFTDRPDGGQLVRVDELDEGTSVWFDPTTWRQTRGDEDATEPMLDAAKEAWSLYGPPAKPPIASPAATGGVDPEPRPRGEAGQPGAPADGAPKAWVSARVNGRRHERCLPVDKAGQLLERYARQGIRARAELIDGTRIGETVYRIRTGKWVAVQG